MSRRERLERVCKLLEGPDSVFSWQKDIVAELPALWAKDDADASLERLLAMSACRVNDVRRARKAKREAQKAYEANNE